MKREEKLNNLKEIKNMLVVIDMVKGFVDEGTLAAPSIKRVIPRQLELLEEYKNDLNGLNVFVRDTHDDNSIEFKTFPPHCLRGTAETEVTDELKAYTEDALDFEKNSTNYMLAPGVLDFFNECENLEKLAFVGCLSEVCVKNAAITARNYFDETNRDVEVGVYEDAIDTFDAPGHNAEEVTEQALKDMASNGVKIYERKRGNK